MESIKRGFGFFKQSWQMALADRDLLKPSFLSMIVSMLVSLVFVVPIVVTMLVFGDESNVGQVISYLLGALMIFCQYVVTYVFSAMTIQLIYDYLTHGDGQMGRAWQIIRRDFWDICTLAGASTLVSLVKRAIEGKRRNPITNALANLLQTVWTEAAFLVLPVMVIEDMGLKDGLKRVGQIVRNNLLLIGLSTVGVGFVTGLIGFLLSATGIALGLGVGFGLVSLNPASGWMIGGGITLGVLIASFFILAAILVGTYTSTAYHTCLYLWAREVEQGVARGQSPQQIPAPGPLGAVLH